uniref:Uncharacterized protein n=1 Tax=Romanomermis culicivorax TaxID=13658 RepID=A0A915HNA5_ROMCU
MLNSSPRMTGLPPSQNSSSKQNKTKGKGKHPPSDDSIPFSESRDPTFIVTPEELPARPVRPKSFSTPKNYEQARRERSSTKFAKKLIFGSKIADKKKRKQSVRAFRPCPACGMLKNNGFKPLLAYEVRRASCTSSRAAFFEKFAQAESSNAQLGSNVRGHSNLTSLKSYD